MIMQITVNMFEQILFSEGKNTPVIGARGIHEFVNLHYNGTIGTVTVLAKDTYTAACLWIISNLFQLAGIFAAYAAKVRNLIAFSRGDGVTVNIEFGGYIVPHFFFFWRFATTLHLLVTLFCLMRKIDVDKETMKHSFCFCFRF